MNIIDKEMEHIDELIRLKKENPDVQIMCMVATEELGTEHHRTLGEFGKPKLDKYVIWNDEIFVDDEDYVKDEICNNLYNDDEINHDTDNEIIGIKTNRIFDTLEKGIGIFINIG